MDTFETIKKFLEEGGKCLLIENGKPIGIILTMEEYELLRSKFETTQTPIQSPPYQGGEKEGVGREVALAELSDIALADDITLEDLGLDELPY